MSEVDWYFVFLRCGSLLVNLALKRSKRGRIKADDYLLLLLLLLGLQWVGLQAMFYFNNIILLVITQVIVVKYQL